MITRPKLERVCRFCRRGTTSMQRNSAKMAVQVRCDRCPKRSPFFVHGCNAIRFWNGVRVVVAGAYERDLHSADMVFCRTRYSAWVEQRVRDEERNWSPAT